jgi:hypothetical protein
MATDDQVTVELFENFAFIADSFVVVGIDGDLSHKLLVFLADQHGDRSGTGSELPNDFVTARQNVAGLRMGGILATTFDQPQIIKN